MHQNQVGQNMQLLNKSFQKKKEIIDGDATADIQFVILHEK